METGPQPRPILYLSTDPPRHCFSWSSHYNKLCTASLIICSLSLRRHCSYRPNRVRVTWGLQHRETFTCPSQSIAICVNMHVYIIYLFSPYLCEYMHVYVIYIYLCVYVCFRTDLMFAVHREDSCPAFLFLNEHCVIIYMYHLHLTEQHLHARLIVDYRRPVPTSLRPTSLVQVPRAECSKL